MEKFCHRQLLLPSVRRKKLVADFEGGRLSSDGGALLLRQLDSKYQLTERLSRCLGDKRDSSRIRHGLLELLRQRLYCIALGYEDANDAGSLRDDPMLKLITGRLPEGCDALASQPTLCRFENAISAKDMIRLSEALVDLYIELHPGKRELIILDVDATDDPTHGQQQLSFFHGYYGQYMYHPLLVFDGLDGFPLGAVLRGGNTHASHGILTILKRLIKKLRNAYPKADIVLRADAGFAVPGLYGFCERRNIYYVIGLIPNNSLRDKVKGLAAKAEEQFLQTKTKQRLFTSFDYRAQSWSRSRRVIAKVEHLPLGPNQRFVLTNIKTLKAHFLYDELYVLRGDTENRIKELKVELRADRLSCHRFVANQFRLLLHTCAYTLMWLLRKHLHGTELATAQVNTLRLKLLKIGARIRETGYRIRIHLASGYPYKELFFGLFGSIAQASP